MLSLLFIFPVSLNLFLLIISIILGYRLTNVNIQGYVSMNVDYNNLIVAIIALVVLVALIGIRGIGSGLSDQSVSLISKSIMFIALWVIPSVYTLSLFSLIPYNIGNILYTILSILYAIGCLMILAKGEAVVGSE